MAFATKLLDFTGSLDPSVINAPEGITILNPYKDHQVCSIVRQFVSKFYNDDHPRTFIFGINPGRFGAGVTGITFTDPVRLEKECGIKNHLPKKQELSSVFIYEMINRFGGPEKFYSAFFLTALSPLGFVRNGKNLNYYDSKELEKETRPFIISSIKKQVSFGCKTEFALCLGEEKNFRYFSKLNQEHRFFDEIISLAHPRFIMQYRMKKKEEYISGYLEVLDRVK